MITTAEIEARAAHALASATEAGRELGLEVRRPVVLHNAFSVVVHLAPTPVAVRIPLVLPPSLRDGALPTRQQRELDAVAWLHETGFPVVPPSPLVPRAPVARDGLSMTFWELAEIAPDHVPYGPIDSALAVGLHAALRDYPEAFELPFLAPANHSVPSLLEMLGGRHDLISAADLDRALREWQALEPLLGSSAAFLDRFPSASIQAIHGDAPSYNVIRTMAGIRFADFEDVNLGPIEWDLSLCTREEVESYDREAARQGLPTLDPEIMQVMNAARMLQMVSSVALIPQLPLLAEGLKPSIDAWREMPFAGGVS